MLLSTRQVAENLQANGFEENKKASKIGGGIAKNARLDLEDKTGKKVISSENNLPSGKMKSVKGESNK